MLGTGDGQQCIRAQVAVIELLRGEWPFNKGQGDGVVFQLLQAGCGVVDLQAQLQVGALLMKGRDQRW